MYEVLKSKCILIHTSSHANEAMDISLIDIIVEMGSLIHNFDF